MKTIIALLILAASTSVCADMPASVCRQICGFNPSCYDHCLYQLPNFMSDIRTDSDEMPDEGTTPAYTDQDVNGSGTGDYYGSDYDGNDSSSDSWEDYSGPAFY